MNTVCLYPEPGDNRVQDTGSQLHIEAGSLRIGGCAAVLRIPTQSGTFLYELDMGSL